LNTALLVADYGVDSNYSDRLPLGALFPPVPGRADYVHHIADALQKSLLSEDDDDVSDHVGDGGAVPMGPAVTGMDIGTGASCIYSTIASQPPFTDGE